MKRSKTDILTRLTNFCIILQIFVRFSYLINLISSIKKNILQIGKNISFNVHDMGLVWQFKSASCVIKWFSEKRWFMKCSEYMYKLDKIHMTWLNQFHKFKCFIMNCSLSTSANLFPLSRCIWNDKSQGLLEIMVENDRCLRF